MKKIVFFLTLAFFLAFPLSAQAQVETEAIPSSGYLIENFQSTINVNQDTSLTIEETIEVNFYEPKHGIFRIIPIIYSAKGKTIRSKLEVLSVTDENNLPYQYQTSRYGQSIKIKIGESGRTLTGNHTYLIRYQVTKVIQRYEDHDEVYWNVTGSEWDTAIEKAGARLDSPWATIKEITCFSGPVGTREKNCLADFQENAAFFETTAPLSWGQDFTIVVALDKANQLHFPGPIRKIIDFLLDNWGYPFALLPLAFLFVNWYKKGRDIRYLAETVYYKPEKAATKIVPLFTREHLPMVYSPIQGLTPAQVGTIIDERVDIHDVVAEIVELARLRFLEIKKPEEKGQSKTGFLFIKKDKDPAVLKDYQQFLLEKLFEGKDEVRLSDLKNKFYKHLQKLKEKLYENLAKEEIFVGNPEKVRTKWGVIFVILIIPVAFLLFSYLTATQNPGPIILLSLTILPAIPLIINMPRRTAWGHSLFRQTVGLRWYLEKGKWREEIAEKHLFLEEMLPLAISLGVVKKLAKQMADLGIQPPSYFTGVTTGTLFSDINRFSTSTRNSLMSAPGGRWSGSSGWSGGSGFSGGGGGGFGGGGGGSW